MNYLLLVVLPHLDTFLFIIAIVGLIATVITAIVYFVESEDACGDEDKAKCNKILKKTWQIFTISMFCMFVTCFIPSTKQLVQLKVISIVSELKGVDKIPQKLVDKINSLLEVNSKNE